MKALLGLYFVLLLVASCRPANTPFRSRRSPKETINNYSVVYPKLTLSDDTLNEYYPSNMEIAILDGDGLILYQLHLKLNKELLPSHFTSSHFSIDSGLVVTQGHPNCFYQGKVEGHGSWRAVFSTCQGLSGWFGDLSDKASLYHMEPLHDSDKLDGPHVMYLDTEHQVRESTCGTPHGKDNDGHDFINTQFDSTIKERLKRQSGNTRNIVELLIVNDYHQYQAYSNNISAVVLRALSIINHVDMLYQALDVRVVVVHSLTWTSSQLIQFSSNPDTLLDLFQAYHSNTQSFLSITHDSAMLITGIDIDESTVGIAFVGTMCSFHSSVGVTQDTLSSVASVATIAAHELGHTFSMNHDDAASCNCPSSSCIMNAVSRFPPATTWSQCSRNELSSGFARAGDASLSRCLGNNPTTIVGTAMCGNGIKEPGEICDCGSVQECNDPCCNATTCSLLGDAECAAGECCQNCKFIPYGMVCRSSRAECDIVEYCTGEDGSCPSDLTHQNGLDCNNGTGYCYDGICTSLESQCTRYFGSSSVPANSRCYEHFNAQGVGWGHCGSDGTNYIQCSSANVFCGSLQCEGGRIIFNAVDSTNSLFAYVRSIDGNECRTFTTPPNVDEVSPGLVIDGTKCGDNNICIARQCVSLSSIVGPPCPAGSNGIICSGSGICSNLDTCACNIGYTGRDCSTTYTGPSTSNILPSSSTIKQSSASVSGTSSTHASSTRVSSSTHASSTRASSTHMSVTMATFPSSVPLHSSSTFITSTILISVTTTSSSVLVTTPTITKTTPTMMIVASSTVSISTVVSTTPTGIFTIDDLLKDGGLVGGLIFLFIALALVAAGIVAAIIAAIVIVKKKNRSVSLPSPRTKYSRGSITAIKKTEVHEPSQFMLNPTTSRPSPPVKPPTYVPPSQSSYVPPTLPTYNNNSPSVTVNRAPPSRPPPSRPKPPPPPENVTKPPRPANRSAPPPTKKPLPPPVATRPPVQRNDGPAKPPTAPKPIKAQWPPPSNDNEPPQTATRPYKPMVPPRK